jgi:hypothetical protein
VSAKLQEHAHRRKVSSEQVLPLEQKQSTTGKGILSLWQVAQAAVQKCNFHHHAHATLRREDAKTARTETCQRETATSDSKPGRPQGELGCFDKGQCSSDAIYH